MKNRVEFEELIKRYNEITLEDAIRECNKVKYPDEAATVLTGYGNQDTCTLCLAVEFRCSDCMWTELDPSPFKKEFACTRGDNEITYNAFNYAENAKQLFKAFKDRAKHMEICLGIYDTVNNVKELNEKQETI